MTKLLRMMLLVLLFGARHIPAQLVHNGGVTVLGPLRSTGTASSVDFTGANSTAPVKTGTLAARPGICIAGQMYFATDSPPGQNLAYCVPPGVWTLGGGASSGMSCQTATSLGFAMNGSDETAQLNSVFATFYAAGGGCLAVDAGKTLRADGQIKLPNNASNFTFPHAPDGTFLQPPYRITGGSPSSALDLRYTGSGGKLMGMAQGTLYLDNITVKTGGPTTDCTPLLYFTLTSIHAENVSFVGSNSTSPCTDAFVGGGMNSPGSNITNTINDWAWGNFYITHSGFGNIRHALLCQSSCNSVEFSSNVLGGVANIGPNQTPDKSLIFFNGYGTGPAASRGNIIENNLIEVINTPVAIYLKNTENAKISGNGCWDGSVNTYCIDGESNATKNNIMRDNFVDGTGSGLIGPNLSMNNYFPWKVIPFTFSGGGSPLIGQTAFQTIEFGGLINKFYMEGDLAGSATVTVRTTAPGSPCGSASDISGGGESMGGAVSKTDTTLTGWTKTLVPGTKVCVVLDGTIGSATQISGYIRVWEGQ
jgi:hypothetical protein